MGASIALAACLAALSVLAVPSSAASPKQADAALDRAIRGLVRHAEGPPAAIAMVQRGPRLKAHKAGVANLRTGASPRGRLRIRQASTTKAFSGAVALSLVARGELSLEDTIGERLPLLATPPEWSQITLGQVLQHTSGLPSYTEDPKFLALLGADLRRGFASRRLWEFAAGLPMRFSPGTDYAYSNTDNIIVALMAEAATGEPYGQLLRRLVLRPLGMKRTSLPNGFRIPRPYIHGYDTDPGQRPEDVSTLLGMSGIWAAGAIVSTPRDMTEFARGYIGRELFPRGVQRRQMNWVPGSSDPPGPGANSAGMAVFRYRTRCGTVFGHTGNIPGYTQLFAATRNGRRSLTFSVNTQLSDDLRPEILEQLRRAQVKAVCAALAR